MASRAALLLLTVCGLLTACAPGDGGRRPAMKTLPNDLVAALDRRIADPVRRHDDLGGVPDSVLTDPSEVFAKLELQNPGLGRTPFRDVVAQMNEWGQQMPPMHFTRYPGGATGASSNDERAFPLAQPAKDSDIARIEGLIGRKLPADLRSLYAIADGGWGPGGAYTAGYGRGFQSLSAVAATLKDLRRRGPGYTGEAKWPDNLLPVADTMGPVSYNLDTGEVVAFNDYWYDDKITIEQAFTTIHPDLETWLREWVAS
jgi:hypothetical protein